MLDLFFYINGYENQRKSIPLFGYNTTNEVKRGFSLFIGLSEASIRGHCMAIDT